MKIIGGILIVLALVVGIVPLFTDCQSQGSAIALANGTTVPMKCHWTGRGELVAAFPLGGVGLLTLLSRKKETMRVLGVMGMLLGALVISLPTTLVGVCAMPDALCNMVMRPTLITTGALTVVLSGFGLVRSLGPEVQETIKAD